MLIVRKMSYVPDLLNRVSPSSGGWSMYEVRYFSHGNNSPDYDNGNTSGTAYAIYDRYHPNGGALASSGAKSIKVGINSTQSDYDTWDDHGSGNPISVTTDSTGLVSINYPSSVVYVFQKPTIASWISAGSESDSESESGINPLSTGSSTQKKVFCNFW